MFDLPVMLMVIICLLIAWERSQREDDTEEWDDDTSSVTDVTASPQGEARK